VATFVRRRKGYRCLGKVEGWRSAAKKKYSVSESGVPPSSAGGKEKEGGPFFTPPPEEEGEGATSFLFRRIRGNGEEVRRKRGRRKDFLQRILEVKEVKESHSERGEKMRCYSSLPKQMAREGKDRGRVESCNHVPQGGRKKRGEKKVTFFFRRSEGRRGFKSSKGRGGGLCILFISAGEEKNLLEKKKGKLVNAGGSRKRYGLNIPK